MITSETLVMLLKVTIVAIIVASVTMRRLVLETAHDDHHRGHEDGHHRGHGNEERAMKCCFLSSQSQQPFIYVYIYSYLFKLKTLFLPKAMDIFF